MKYLFCLEAFKVLVFLFFLSILDIESLKKFLDNSKMSRRIMLSKLKLMWNTEKRNLFLLLVAEISTSGYTPFEMEMETI